MIRNNLSAFYNLERNRNNHLMDLVYKTKLLNKQEVNKKRIASQKGAIEEIEDSM